MKPTLCMIHEEIGQHSAISKVAMAGVCVALQSGYSVTVVAQKLDKSLQGNVEWLPLYKPRRVFLYQWLIARKAIAAALGGRKFDIVHVHQPQVADFADLMQCHFLTRSAYEHNALDRPEGLRSALSYLQQRGVLLAEDRFWRNFPDSTHLLFCSEMLQREHDRLYGNPLLSRTIENGIAPFRIPSEGERAAARSRFAPGAGKRLVVGYLGGAVERKGWRRLVAALTLEDGLYLLIGGQFTANLNLSTLPGCHNGIGIVTDIDAFYAACDVFVVPSLFDPCPLVVFEAIARGVPVIATRGVGSLPTLLRHRAGYEWQPEDSLADLIHFAIDNREACHIGGKHMAHEQSVAIQTAKVLDAYEQILEEQLRTRNASGTEFAKRAGRTFGAGECKSQGNESKYGSGRVVV